MTFIDSVGLRFGPWCITWHYIEKNDKYNFLVADHVIRSHDSEALWQRTEASLPRADILSHYLWSLFNVKHDIERDRKKYSILPPSWQKGNEMPTFYLLKYSTVTEGIQTAEFTQLGIFKQYTSLMHYLAFIINGERKMNKLLSKAHTFLFYGICTLLHMEPYIRRTSVVQCNY